MSTATDMVTTMAPPKPAAARINWVRAAPWLYTIGLFVLWELLVIALDMPPTILPAPTDVFAAIESFSDCDPAEASVDVTDTVRSVQFTADPVRTLSFPSFAQGMAE